jgi:hypothetical protein
MSRARGQFAQRVQQVYNARSGCVTGGQEPQGTGRTGKYDR